MSLKSLPEFGAPPIAEAVLGLELSPLHGWSIPHYGLLWAKVKERYPRFEVHPTLPSAANSDGQIFQRILVQVTSVPRVRCWFIEDSGHHLMQIQNDRLIHNWRKQDAGPTYPRYEAVRDALLADWKALSDFCDEYRLGGLMVSGCEVTYVNSIPRGSGWEEPKDIPSLFPAWSGSLISGGPRSVSLDLTYALKGPDGRLRVHLEPAARSEQWDTLQLTLTAVGRPESHSLDDALMWLNTAREQVVQAFTDFTSDKMHAIWQRKDPR